jgi:hypothetical protein
VSSMCQNYTRGFTRWDPHVVVFIRCSWPPIRAPHVPGDTPHKHIKPRTVVTSLLVSRVGLEPTTIGLTV